MRDEVRVGNVKVDEIRFHSHNIRRDLGDLRALSASIRRFGVMQPVVVENRGGHWRLRAGHRRVAAARLAGLSKVPAVIHSEQLDDDEWIIAAVQENVMRRGIDDQERLRAVHALRDLGCTWEGIAEAFGVRANTVRSWIRPQPRSTAGRTAARSTRLSGARVQALVRVWRAEAATRDVPVAELLQAFETLGATGELEQSTPAAVTLARAERSRGDGGAAVVDQIAVQRAINGEQVPLTRDERLEAVSRLWERDLNDSEIGALLHASTRQVLRDRQTLGLESRHGKAAS